MDKAARAARETVQGAIEALTRAKKALARSNQQLEDAQGAFDKAEVRSPVDGGGGAQGRGGQAGAEAGNDLFQIATDIFALEVPLEPRPRCRSALRPGSSGAGGRPRSAEPGHPGRSRRSRTTR